MATDPNKALLNDSKAVEASQPGFGLTRDQWAKVFNGQKVEGFTLVVVNGECIGVVEPDPEA